MAVFRLIYESCEIRPSIRCSYICGDMSFLLFCCSEYRCSLVSFSVPASERTRNVAPGSFFASRFSIVNICFSCVVAVFLLLGQLLIYHVLLAAAAADVKCLRQVLCGKRSGGLAFSLCLQEEYLFISLLVAEVPMRCAYIPVSHVQMNVLSLEAFSCHLTRLSLQKLKV